VLKGLRERPIAVVLCDSCPPIGRYIELQMLPWHAFGLDALELAFPPEKVDDRIAPEIVLGQFIIRAMPEEDIAIACRIGGQPIEILAHQLQVFAAEDGEIDVVIPGDEAIMAPKSVPWVMK
jgi:hypothetical protein